MHLPFSNEKHKSRHSLRVNEFIRIDCNLSKFADYLSPETEDETQVSTTKRQKYILIIIIESILKLIKWN